MARIESIRTKASIMAKLESIMARILVQSGLIQKDRKQLKTAENS